MLHASASILGLLSTDVSAAKVTCFRARFPLLEEAFFV